ncbi:A disintegrin and metalloproteinase with thrombospondin motifs adt-2-like isoform X2 [Leptopilina boulardi]|uniref:A disintegrin and metalloproteinase with thrombospondin motifs adt-2-like isoform X2 n=1 Tax=Leptopilina boulardi TaxID=63433 RepID=UPI0021F50123|nr:A disintegrin and metalloproteinase with thrombospondin motifs adt-2-like isoform X2 [Leptopilina boulardi]
MYYFILLFCILFVSLTQSFNVDDDYEVVPIRYKRQANNGLIIQMQRKRQRLQFYLYSTEGLLAGTKTKIYTAENAKNGVHFTLIPMNQLNLQFYQDRRSQSSVTQSVDKNGKTKFTGHINNNIILRPMPNHIRQRRDLLNRNSSFFETDAEGFINTDDHIIYEKSFNDSSPHSSPNVFDDKFMKIKSVNRRDVSKTPNIVYPEILVYVDEILFKKFNYNVQKAVEYTLSYWNGVDLRYRQFQNPKIRLYVTGIVLIKNALPFTTPALCNNGMYEAELILDKFGKFLYHDNIIQRIKDYDISMYMTGRKIYSKREHRDTKGVSNLAKPCYERLEKYYSAAVIFDDNSYKSIISSSHELGHILGALHDENDGTMSCLQTSSFIMSYNRYNRNMFFFSPCSVKNIKETLSQKSSSCLRNNPANYKNNYPLQRLLPGQIMSLDEQCKNMGFHSCYYKKTTCVKLKCIATLKDGTVKEYTFNSPPAEGSYCGIGKYCIEGECQPFTFQKHVNNIRRS